MDVSKHVQRIIATALLLLCSGALGAQTISVSGNPPLMRINTAVAGSQPTSVTTATTTYTVLALAGGKITGKLLTTLPVNTTLTISLNAPSGATSLGPVVLDLTEKDLVVNMPELTNSTQAITYTFSATAPAGVVPNSNRTVELRVR